MVVAAELEAFPRIESGQDIQPVADRAPPVGVPRP